MTASSVPGLRDKLAGCRPLADHLAKELREHADDCICDRWVIHHSQVLAVVVQAAIDAAVTAELEAAAEELDDRAMELWRAYKSASPNDPRRASPHTEGESDGWENAGNALRARVAARNGGTQT